MKKYTNLTKFFLIPLALIGLWLGLTFFYISTFESFSIVPFNHRDKLNKYIDKPLLDNQKIIGEFIAVENNLGIIAIRFQLRSRIPFAQEDDLVFRLKEKGTGEWYYIGNYKSGLTYDVPFLPFGFPLIADSKGKVYQFELESLKGNPRNALIVSTQYPQLQSKYAIDRGRLKSDPNFLLKYFRQKYIGSFDNPSVLFSSAIYALPLLFYLAWITGLIKKLLKPFSKQVMWIETKIMLLRKKGAGVIYIITLLFFVVIDILRIQLINDLAYVVIIAIWLYLIKMFKIKSIVTFAVGLAILFLTAVSNTVSLEAVAEKSGAWAYMFLLAGTIQLLMEIRKEKPLPKV
jgi:hypothetical protein